MMRAALNLSIAFMTRRSEMSGAGDISKYAFSTFRGRLSNTSRPIRWPMMKLVQLDPLEAPVGVPGGEVFKEIVGGRVGPVELRYPVRVLLVKGPHELVPGGEVLLLFLEHRGDPQNLFTGSITSALPPDLASASTRTFLSSLTSPG